MNDHLLRRGQPAANPARAGQRWPRLVGQLVLGVAMAATIGALAFGHREWLHDALALAATVNMPLLAAAGSVVLLSYLVSAQVFGLVLRPLGYRIGLLPLWATALIAITMSQTAPGGGVGGFAFLVRSLRRRGVGAGDAALAATLEAGSYLGAMPLFGVWSLVYLAVRAAGAGVGLPFLLPLLGGIVVLPALGVAALVLSHDTSALERWFGRAHRVAVRLAGLPRSDAWVGRVVAAIAQGRALVVAHPGTLAQMVLVQSVAFGGHSLALLLILASLGASISPAAVVAAFGVALLAGWFNVLPGGGGAVEAILATTLVYLAAGPAALPAAILFRLVQFWLLLPVAGASYLWLERIAENNQEMKS